MVLKYTADSHGGDERVSEARHLQDVRFALGAGEQRLDSVLDEGTSRPVPMSSCLMTDGSARRKMRANGPTVYGNRVLTKMGSRYDVGKPNCRGRATHVDGPYEVSRKSNLQGSFC